MRLSRLLLSLVAIILTPVLPLHAQTPLLTGYFPQWGLYDQPQYTVKNLVTSHAAEKLDQLIYAQAFVTNGRCSIADPNADTTRIVPADQSLDGIADTPTQSLRGNFNQLLKLKRLYPNLKILISLEGQARDFAADAQAAQRQAFVASCVDLFLRGDLAPGVHAPGLFDGIDVDWEFPHPEDSANFLALLTELRRQSEAVHPGALLSIAVGPSPRMTGDPANLPAIARLVDHIGIMSYDYTGPWARSTGFIAPFSNARPGGFGGSVQGSVQAWIAAGVPASKLFMGLPFYGYGWHVVSRENNGLFQQGEPIRGDRPYPYIEALIAKSTVYREESSQSPWLYDGDAFWTYDDPTSIRHKTAFAVEQQLGGLMIWHLGEDTPTATLLNAAHEALHVPWLTTYTPPTEPFTTLAPPQPPFTPINPSF
ncbi:glycoside hydrolase family 18 protein [Granulicella tundricola]|uniref:glycoside hydrolase family 18 protein n=1 Tax=Granulicella tundricola TaxID=940615 RepID=UPI0001DB7467|nr:glycosyl hydrolase family 18 protein [Granulicella tundricola]